MRTGRLVEAIGWRSAFGELVLIVVGVTIALAGTAWYERLQERRDELVVLQQLAVALELDLAHLTEVRDMRKGQASNVRALRQHIEVAAPYSPDLAFGSLLGWFGTRTNSAPFEALKSRGLELVSDESLRLDLIRYYADIYPLVESSYLNDRTFVVNAALPYYRRNFRQDLDEVGSASWTPLNYESVRTDSYFWNLSAGKLLRLESRILPYIEDARELLERLLSGIERELAAQ